MLKHSFFSNVQNVFITFNVISFSKHNIVFKNFIIFGSNIRRTMQKPSRGHNGFIMVTHVDQK